MAHITTNPAEFASASNAVSRFFSAFGKALVALGNSESRVRQAQALYALSDAEREIFLLRTSAGLSFSAAAATLEIPIGTAKTRMRSALKRLRESLRDHAPWTDAGPTNDEGSSNETDRLRGERA